MLGHMARRQLRSIVISDRATRSIELKRGIVRQTRCVCATYVRTFTDRVAGASTAARTDVSGLGCGYVFIDAGSDREWQRHDPYENERHVFLAWLPGMSLEKFVELPVAAKKEEALRLIDRAIAIIAADEGFDLAPFRAASDMMRASGLDTSFVSVRKHSRNRKWYAELHVDHEPLYARGTLRVYGKVGDLIAERRVFEDSPDELRFARLVKRDTVKWTDPNTVRYEPPEGSDHQAVTLAASRDWPLSDEH